LDTQAGKEAGNFRIRRAQTNDFTHSKPPGQQRFTSHSEKPNRQRSKVIPAVLSGFVHYDV
jgi:hypothetical protein